MSDSVDPTSELREQVKKIVERIEYDSAHIEQSGFELYAGRGMGFADRINAKEKLRNDATDELLALFKKSQKQVGWAQLWKEEPYRLMTGNLNPGDIHDNGIPWVPVYINESVRQEK